MFLYCNIFLYNTNLVNNNWPFSFQFDNNLLFKSTQLPKHLHSLWPFQGKKLKIFSYKKKLVFFESFRITQVLLLSIFYMLGLKSYNFLLPQNEYKLDTSTSILCLQYNSTLLFYHDLLYLYYYYYLINKYLFFQFNFLVPLSLINFNFILMKSLLVQKLLILK